MTSHRSFLLLLLVGSTSFLGHGLPLQQDEDVSSSINDNVLVQRTHFPPQLHPPGEEHVAESGKTFSIRCSGQFPVEWVPPMDEVPLVTSGSDDGGSSSNDSSSSSSAVVLPLSKRIVITEETVYGESPRPHLSYLEVTSLHHLDTGFYYCRYKGTGVPENDVGQQSSDNMTSTYLYVSDSNYLFDTTVRFAWVNVPQYQETVIPCRPNSPSVEMTFRHESQDITNSLESRLLRYDPKRGLIIERGTMSFHTGMLVCVARQGQKVDMFNAILQFQPDPGIVPTPFIEKPHADAIFVGGNISLACQLPIDLSMPHIELRWEYPHPDIEAQMQSGRIVEEKQRRERIVQGSDLATRYPSSSLMIIRPVTIDPVMLQDERTYSCMAVVSGTGKASSPHKYHLQKIMADADQAYISKPDFFGDPVITVARQGLPVNWVFNLRANPNPEFTWYHPSGHEIDYGTLEKYEMDIDTKRDKVRLIINNVGLRDTGQYRFRIEVEDSSGISLTEDVDLFLQFVRSPSVSLGLSQPEQQKRRSNLFLAGQAYNLSCDVEGYPINRTSLRWEFSRCDSYHNCSDDDVVEVTPDTMEPSDGNTLGDYHYAFRSTLGIRAEQSGVFTCHVCSQEEPMQKAPVVCNSSSFRFFLTDFSTGFDTVFESSPAPLKSSTDADDDDDDATVVERDAVTLTCAASVYEYQAVSWSKKTLQSWEGVAENYVQDNGTEFSHVSMLRFDEMKMRDAGTYRCMALSHNRSRQSEVRLQEVSVLNIIPPNKGEFNNMNGSEIQVDTSTRLSLTCSATGRPFPVVTWDKDGVPITEADLKNHQAMELNDGGQVLFIKFAVVANSGLYTCSATNRGGHFSANLKLVVRAQQEPVSTALVASIVVGLVVLFIISAVLLWKVKIYNRKYKELTQAELDMFIAGDPQSINPDLGVDDQADLLPYNREFEFSRDRLKLGKQLGSGAFGRVVKAQAFGIVTWERSTTVAVKMVKPHADITYIRALMSELKIMMHLGRHLNIVNLLGSSTTGLGKRELLVIVEYCRFGNIQKYLLLHRSNFINQIDPDTAEINFQIGSDIIERHGNDLARAREEDEMSAAYAGRRLSISTTDGGGCSSAAAARPEQQQMGYVHMAAATAAAAAAGTEEPAHCGGNGDNVAQQQHRRPPSVRYIVDPATHQQRQQRGRRMPPRQASVQSTSGGDSSDAMIVLTDMTTVPLEEDTMDSNGPEENKFYKRSLSTVQGPGWRSNVRGDYDTQTVRPISTKDIVCWAYQVARGMEYLASKKVMHGDLACRNILLAADNVVKICDFGLAKDIYKTNNYRKKTDGPLPVKWMAIESLRDHVFSTQSDVWSFGIVLWELFSLGKTPYPGIEAGEHYHMLLDGYRMEKPEYCPRVIYRIMTDCWKAEPCQRPDFHELTGTLGDLLEVGERDHYLDLSKKLIGVGGVGAGAVENRDYLAMFSSPDFNHQMTPRPNGDIMEEEEEEGYLVPTMQLLQQQQMETSEEGYLLPKEMMDITSPPSQVTVEAVDDSGYLMPKSVIGGHEVSGKKQVVEDEEDHVDERKPMLPNGEFGKAVVIAK